MSTNFVTRDNYDATVAAALAGDVRSAYMLGVAFCGTASIDALLAQLRAQLESEPGATPASVFRKLPQLLLRRDFDRAHYWFEHALGLESPGSRSATLAYSIAQRCVRVVREVPLQEFLERMAAGDEHPGGTVPQRWCSWTLYAMHVLDTRFSFLSFTRGSLLDAALLGTGLLAALGSPDPAAFDNEQAAGWAEELAEEYHERLATMATFAATGRDILGTIAAGLYSGATADHSRWLLCRANQDLYGTLIAFLQDKSGKIRHVSSSVPPEVRHILTEAVRNCVAAQVLAADGTLRPAAVARAPHLVSLWAVLAMTENFSPERPVDVELSTLLERVNAVRHQDVVAAAIVFHLDRQPNSPAGALSALFERSLGHFDGMWTPQQLGDYDPFFAAQLVGTAHAEVAQLRHAEELVAAEKRRREMQEKLIAGAAHQFGGTVAALIANARRTNEARTTLAETRSLNSLLELFALVSGDAARMRAALTADRDGDADMCVVAASALRHAIVALLAERRRGSIERFLFRYARDNGLVPPDLGEKQWRQDKQYKGVGPRLATAWEDDLVDNSAGGTLAKLCEWAGHHLVPISAAKVDARVRRFSHDGALQALVLTVLTELLINAIKHYDDNSDVPIALAVEDDGSTITLSCSNPASRSSRLNRAGGGFGRGLDYLDMIADKLGGELIRPDASMHPCTTFRFTIPDSP